MSQDSRELDLERLAASQQFSSEGYQDLREQVDHYSAAGQAYDAARAEAAEQQANYRLLRRFADTLPPLLPYNPSSYWKGFGTEDLSTANAILRSVSWVCFRPYNEPTHAIPCYVVGSRILPKEGSILLIEAKSDHGGLPVGLTRIDASRRKIEAILSNPNPYLPPPHPDLLLHSLYGPADELLKVSAFTPGSTLLTKGIVLTRPHKGVARFAVREKDVTENTAITNGEWEIFDVTRHLIQLAQLFGKTQELKGILGGSGFNTNEATPS